MLAQTNEYSTMDPYELLGLRKISPISFMSVSLMHGLVKLSYRTESGESCLGESLKILLKAHRCHRRNRSWRRRRWRRYDADVVPVLVDRRHARHLAHALGNRILRESNRGVEILVS